MEKLWAEKSKNGSMPSYQMCMLLPQIRKNFEVDEEAVDEMITELDKGICRATLICPNSILFILFFFVSEENGLITLEGYEKVCHHFLVAK